ncbi:MAG: hypothetical protein O7G86_09535, partial [Gammaproteobacteria bacterium]|nr:hypothetical protein [Gammaproteobacteria bacterium]
PRAYAKSTRRLYFSFRYAMQMPASSIRRLVRYTIAASTSGTTKAWKWGQEWRAEIAEALDNASTVLFYQSAASIQSGHSIR